MKKRSLFFTLLLTLLFTTSVYALDFTVEGDKAIFENVDYQKSDSIRVFSDGTQIQFDVSPQIIYGRTLVPMRAIFESIGLTVNWEDSTKTASGNNAENSIALTIGSNKAIVNNKEKSLDVPASIINGRTMVPLRFLSENMGYNVVWVGDSNLILMSKKDVVEWRYEGYENVEPYREYEVKYVNGTKTSETRYNGNTHGVVVEWRFEGHENVEPYKEYEVKYIDGVRTSETRYTGTNFYVPKPKVGEPTICSFSVNSADGVELAWMANNQTGKRIKYYSVTLHMYNAVGDPAYDEITGKSVIQANYVGPVEIDQSLVIYHIIAYTGVCDKIIIGNINFEYFDGTKEDVWVGHTAYESSSLLY